MTSERGLRGSRRLTPGGKVMFEERIREFTAKLRIEQRYMEIIIEDIKEHPEMERQLAITYKSELFKHFTAFEEISVKFNEYLRSQRSDESTHERALHDMIATEVRKTVTATIENLETILQTIATSEKQQQIKTELVHDYTDSEAHMYATETTDQQEIIPPPEEFKQSSESVQPPDPFENISARKSRSAKANSLLYRQRAKLQAAKVRMKYTEQEADILKQKAALEADLKLLNSKREIDEAETELRAIHDILDGEENDSERSSVCSDIVRQRTEEYVRGLSNNFEEDISPSVMQDVESSERYEIKVPSTRDRTLTISAPAVTTSQVKTQQSAPNAHTSVITATEQIPNVTKTGHQTPGVRLSSGPTNNAASVPPRSNLNLNAPVFVPSNTGMLQTDVCNEFSKFMVKRDLLLSRLTKYDDKPDMFLAWKASFKNVMSELSVTSAEETDLLVKWLGPDSSKQALRIRAANAGDPNRCVKRIWERLEDRFGSPEIVEDSLKRRLAAFPKLAIKDHKQLFELADIVAEIEAIMENDRYKVVFAHYDSSSGVNPIVSKLPHNIQEKWTTEANKYKTRNNMIFPPFTMFSNFIQKIAKVKNDPSFVYDEPREFKTQYTSNRLPSRYGNTRSVQMSCARTDTTESKSSTGEKVENVCPLHGTNHILNACRGFRIKPISERKDFLKRNGICFRCCGPKKHIRRDCKELLKCAVCQSREHPSALHTEPERIVNNVPVNSHEGEKGSKDVKSSCTRICGQATGTSKSCSKIMLVKVYPKGNPDQVRKMYSLIDDQSNRSLATSNFFHTFGDNGPETEYILSSCAGKFTTSGRLAKDYVIESLDGTCVLSLPTIIECNDIPNNRQEIASPNVAMQYPHLADIAPFIPEIDENAQIDLLIGRDLISVHHVLDHRIGKNDLPYAQKLPLGWAIIGEVCLGKTHPPDNQDCVSVNKITILNNGRATYLKPCQNELLVETNIFHTTDKDETIGSSIEDDAFLRIMNAGFERDSAGHWVAPLPFRENRQVLENNRPMALKRAKSLDSNLKSNPNKLEHVKQFMQKMIENTHAEIAPPISISAERWYLPMFGIYHPKKPDSIRVVFDASAVYNGKSLNSVLLKGPDLTNSLLGILLRFRKEAIAITADVEQMFYNFRVTENHRDYLRFIWHAENDVQKPLIDYRMTVHVFGNSPSPSVATYGLRKSVQDADTDVKDFVEHNFYVDDGLLSCQDVETAVDLVKRTQKALSNGGNLRLHKIASNSKDALDQFPADDLAKNLKDLKFESDNLPLQRSLGMAWDINMDCFTFQVANDTKPFNKRGVLSTINGLFDPIGFTAPVSVRGKLLLREMMASLGHTEWDDPLPDTYLQPWTQWVNTLPDLEQCCIPRMYSDISYAQSLNKEVHIFSDASKDAIGAVAYLKLLDTNHVTVSFLLGKAKVAPPHGSTIPRLELCAAVLAAELSDLIKEHLGIGPAEMYFYTDSKVVLGYLTNESKRFFVYVGNRVRRIRASCDPKRWKYVPTEQNPADIATRGINPTELPNSMWIQGPKFLQDVSLRNSEDEHYPLIDSDKDKEIRPDVKVAKTQTVVQDNLHDLGTRRFTGFSEWRTLIRTISLLKHFVRRWTNRNDKSERADEYKSPEALKQAEHFIIRQVQSENYADEIERLSNGSSVSKNSSL